MDRQVSQIKVLLERLYARYNHRVFVPLDVHMGRRCRILGLHDHKAISLSTARKVTEGFATKRSRRWRWPRRTKSIRADYSEGRPFRVDFRCDFGFEPHSSEARRRRVLQGKE